MMNGAAAFGLGWRSDIPLLQFEQMACDGAADVEVRLVHQAPIRCETARHGNVSIFQDGTRYHGDDGTVIDIFGCDRIMVTPGLDWQGELPVHFYSTVAAMLLALRGFMPVHGTALDVEGRAVLICGRSGAGKSSLAANLVALGAKLISDDLSVLRMMPGEAPRLLAGRPGIRLHPVTAAWLAARREIEAVLPSHGAKSVARPPRVAAFSEHRLDRVILLDRQETRLPVPLQIAALRAQIFRPRLMRKLPGHDARMCAMADIVHAVGLKRMLDLSRYDAGDAANRACDIFGILDDVAA